jgi:hypothetical protein
MDLPVLLQREEGKTLEFTRDLSSPDKVLQTLIAFANTTGAAAVAEVLPKPQTLPKDLIEAPVRLGRQVCPFTSITREFAP